MRVYIDRDMLEDFAMSCIGGEVSLRQIHDFPAADVVERKRGMWIGMKPNWYVCSECHYSLYSKNPPPYCSTCGAYMREERE